MLLFQIIPRGNVTQITALYAEFINGNDPIPNQEQVLNEIEWLKTVDVHYNRSLSSYAHQSCSDLIFAVKYQETPSKIRHGFVSYYVALLNFRMR